MSACDLWFELGEHEFRPDDPIRATLVIRANKNVRADAVSVTLVWRTHGKGNRDSATVDTVELGALQLEADEEHREDIELTAPSGPVTYRGTLINVDWYLHARADVPWAIDPKTETELLLLPAPPEEVPGEGYRERPERIARPHVLGTGTPKAATPPNIIFVVLFMVVGLAVMGANGSGGGVIGAVVGVAFASFFVWRALKPKLAKTKLGNVEIALDPEQTQAGASVELSIRLCPPGPVRLNGVAAKLLGQEVAVSGSGTNKTTHRHTLHSELLQLSKRRVINAGEEVTLEASITIPEDAAPSFEASDNKVRWTVETDLDIEGWPDLHDEQVLTVYPS